MYVWNNYEVKSSCFNLIGANCFLYLHLISYNSKIYKNVNHGSLWKKAQFVSFAITKNKTAGGCKKAKEVLCGKIEAK